MEKKQLSIRLLDHEKRQIKILQKQYGYKTITDYLIAASLNKLRQDKTYQRVVTLSLSPAIDYIINFKTSKLVQHQPNQFIGDDKYFVAAGKGIHESIILDRFGVQTLTLHYSGGFTGDYLKKHIDLIGLEQIQYKSDEDTRINLKLNFTNQNSKINYEISEIPPAINETAKYKILKQISLLNKNEILTIAGSFNSKDEKFVEDICIEATNKKVNLVFDLSSIYILQLLKYKPYLIKPNKFELEHILNLTINTEKKLLLAMEKLQKKGAQNIIVSLGAKGSILLTTKGEFYKAEIISPIKAISPQGSGDALVGTFLAKKNLSSIEEQFRWANAAGAATACSMTIAELSEIIPMLENIKITKLEL